MKKTLLLLALLPFFLSCSDDDNGNEKDKFIINPDFPVYNVDFELNVSSISENAELNEKGAYKKFYDLTSKEVTGVGGLLVYNSEKGFKAYDYACPVEGQDLLYKFDIESNHAKCIKCKSIFNLENGHPTEGPALEKKYRLVDYKLTNRGISTLWLITNPRYKTK